MVKCYVKMMGEKLWICIEDGALVTTSAKEEATTFDSIEECNDWLKGTVLCKIDGYEEV